MLTLQPAGPEGSSTEPIVSLTVSAMLRFVAVDAVGVFVLVDAGPLLSAVTNIGPGGR